MERFRAILGPLTPLFKSGIHQAEFIPPGTLETLEVLLCGAGPFFTMTNCSYFSPRDQ